jgi:hypothetical protein
VKLNCGSPGCICIQLGLNQAESDCRWLSEVADFLEMFVSEVKVPESAQNKSVRLQVGMKTMKEIISDLGLEVSETNK